MTITYAIVFVLFGTISATLLCEVFTMWFDKPRAYFNYKKFAKDRLLITVGVIVFITVYAVLLSKFINSILPKP